jgi:hypothetical protein
MNRRTIVGRGWRRHIVVMLAGAALGILAGVQIVGATNGYSAPSLDQRSGPAVAPPTATPPIELMREGVAAVLALAVVSLGIVKPAVDAITLALPRLRKWGNFLVSVVVGNVIVLLLAIASNIALTLQVGAQIVLASLMIATGSVCIHELHDRAHNARTKAAKGSEQAVKPVGETTSDSSTVAIAP